MELTEDIKLEAKRRAHYQCVVCRKPVFLHVHQLTPQKDGDSGSIDNAATLCVECHDLYGNDPTSGNGSPKHVITRVPGWTGALVFVIVGDRGRRPCHMLSALKSAGAKSPCRFESCPEHVQPSLPTGRNRSLPNQRLELTGEQQRSVCAPRSNR